MQVKVFEHHTTVGVDFARIVLTYRHREGSGTTFLPVIFRNWIFFDVAMRNQ